VSTDVTPSVTAALHAAAIPAFKVGASRHARLEDAERDVYFWILRQFASSGRSSAAEIQRAAEGLGVDPMRSIVECSQSVSLLNEPRVDHVELYERPDRKQLVSGSLRARSASRGPRAPAAPRAERTSSSRPCL
jgi:hypothetical protein